MSMQEPPGATYSAKRDIYKVEGDLHVHNHNQSVAPLTEPPFRDLQRETDSKGGKTTFLRLRFADRAIEYAHHDKVWQAFKEFHESANAFSWWLIAGGAGTGKSRTALEFCDALNNTGQWRAGFLDIEKTDPGCWHTWCPEQDNLLVLDYVTRNDPHKLSGIFNTLSRRAERNEFGGKRIRFLLLEREYKDRSTEKKELDWYRPLNKNMGNAFDLDTLGDDDLYKIAEEAAKSLWESPHPLPGRTKFLSELEKLDKKKRPLFTILLAGYLAQVDPQTQIEPREVLDFAIEQEFERFLTPAGVEEAPTLLEALMLSTITGGKLGACSLQNKHRLWSSGLGVREKDTGHFLFYPIEPDLLGERFVLNRGGGESPGRISSEKRLEELLQRGWEEAPLETANFLERCAQDFASTDSEWIGKLFLSAMPVIKESFLRRFVYGELFVSLTALLDVATGRELFQAMANSATRKK